MRCLYVTSRLFEFQHFMELDSFPCSQEPCPGSHESTIFHPISSLACFPCFENINEVYEITLLSVCLCVLLMFSFSMWSLSYQGGLWDHLAVRVSVHPSPNCFALYAIRAVSKESRRLVLPKTSFPSTSRSSKWLLSLGFYFLIYLTTL
jgi:hypothetical protein